MGSRSKKNIFAHETWIYVGVVLAKTSATNSKAYSSDYSGYLRGV